MFARPLIALILLGAAGAVALGNVHFFYNDPAGFEAQRAQVGCTALVGIETFDDCLTTAAGELDCYPYPPGLQHGVPNPPGAPDGLCQPLDIYSSLLDPECDVVSLGDGFVGNSTIVVGANYFSARTSLDFRQYGGYCAVAFLVMDGLDGGEGVVEVYDMNDVELDRITVDFGFPQDGNWIGVVVEPDQGPIGRIVYRARERGGELCDDVELYTGEAGEGCPQPGGSGKYCTADVVPNNGDGIWDYAIDGDCTVQLDDLAQLLANFRCADCTHEDGDVFPENGDGIWQDGVDGDGVIDLADLAEMLSQYRDDCN